MYYQNYEDYMRNVLGYSIEPDIPTYNRNYEMYLPVSNNTQQVSRVMSPEMEEWYPECYRIIQPIVENACENCHTEITKEVVDNLTEDVFQKVCCNTRIVQYVNGENRSTAKEENNRSMEKKNSVNATSSNLSNASIRNRNNSQSKIVENRGMEEENRQQARINNPLLRDLIRILILRQLFGGNFPHRPPLRPPFPGGPGNRPPTRPTYPGGRPPRPEPRDYENYLKF